MNLRQYRLWFCLLCLLTGWGLAQEQTLNFETPLLEQERTFLERLDADPENASVRFAAGVTQFLRAAELLGQAWYRYGLESSVGQQLGIPFLRLPVPTNPQPESISYADFRAELEAVNGQLERAETTLAGLGDEGSTSDPAVVLDLSEAYLDYDGKLTRDAGESLTTLLAVLNRRFVEEAAPLELRLDRGDAHWMRGYSHLLMALVEVVLAHDSQTLFSYTAQLFFPRAEVAADLLYKQGNLLDMDDGRLVDQIALVHLALRVPLLEPERLAKALEHAQAVTEQAGLMWVFILAETDNDREWIPNPSQDSVLPVQVTQDVVDAWLLFVEETRALWRGEKLVPHWRLPEGQGIDLPRAFLEPQDFDLVLWIQGGAAAPYVETGEVVSAETLQRIWDVFGGQFIGFALWFN